MARFIFSVFLISLAAPTSALFFGGSSCGCAPPPACPPPVAPACVPAASAVPACGGSYSAPAAYPQQSYSAPVYSPQPQPQYTPQTGSYAQPQPQYAPQTGSYAQPQPQYTPQTGSYVKSTVNAPPPPPPLPQSAPYQVQPAAIQYEQGFAAAGDTLREVEEEESEAKSTNSTESITPNDASEPIDIKDLKLTEDEECNSEELRKIIIENIDEDLNSSKRLIQLAAEAKFGGRFDVICSSQDFSYVTNTELYCQHTKEAVSCYAYRQL